MGSAAVKFMLPESNYEVVESSKMTAKDVDTRRRNSLAVFMRDWQQCETYDQQEISMGQVCGVTDHEGMSNRYQQRNQAAFGTLNICPRITSSKQIYSKRGAGRFNPTLGLGSFCRRNWWKQACAVYWQKIPTFPLLRPVKSIFIFFFIYYEKVEMKDKLVLRTKWETLNAGLLTRSTGHATG